MTNPVKIILTIAIFFFGSFLLGVSKEIAPHAGWIRIAIGVGAFALLMWLWGEKAKKEKR